jgi:hypothetical protein
VPGSLACLLRGHEAVVGPHEGLRMDDDRRLEFPAAGTVVDLIAASRAEAFMSWAVASAGKELLVLVPIDEGRRPVDLGPGERIDVVWRGSSELLCLPVVLSAVLPGERPCWRLRAAGVVKRGQRRDAVRAPLAGSLRLNLDGWTLAGTTVDVSEGGTRCLLEGPVPAAPEKGQIGRLKLELPELTIDNRVEVARRHPRSDGRIELSLRFIGLSDFDADRIRRLVFARLRELRQRGML